MLKLKQAELEEIKEVRKSVFGDADFDDEGLCHTAFPFPTW